MRGRERELMMVSYGTIHAITTFIHCLYPSQLEIQNTTNTRIQLHILRFKLYKQNYLNFPNSTVPIVCYNITVAHEYKYQS